MSVDGLNPKKIEKIIRSIDKKLDELQKEMDVLRKKRGACKVLLGQEDDSSSLTPGAAPGDSVETKPKAKRTRKGIHSQIYEVLGSNEKGLTASEIAEGLKNTYPDLLTGNRPEGTIYAAIKRHPEMFIKGENGKWVRSKMKES